MSLIHGSGFRIACVQTSPLPQKNRENRVPVYICINYFLLLFHPTVEKVLTDQHDWGLFLENVLSYSLECSQHLLLS